MAFTLAVVGVGLIGGSFALAAKEAGIAQRVFGVSSARTLEKATALRIIDEGLPLEEAVPQADLVFLSSTIHAIIETIPRLQGLVKPDAIVTDAGSTKRAIVRAAEGVEDMYFVGGHPMAGKEKGGVEQADSGLFRGRLWVLTTDHGQRDDRFDKLEAIVRHVGARPVLMPAAEHDAAVARTSHLPQLLSTALAASLEQGFHHEAPVISGPGLMDATRLALSPYPVWKDILETNRDQIQAAMADFLDEWKHQYTALADDVNLEDQFLRAAAFARRLRE
jgi:prephenate dehydrogenase